MTGSAARDDPGALPQPDDDGTDGTDGRTAAAVRPGQSRLIGRRQRLTAAQDLMAQGGRRLLGITGPPGSGKSTVANELSAALGPDACVVPADGFHLANAVLDDLGIADRKGAPDTFDPAGFQALLRRLRSCADEVVYAPQFVRRIEESIAGAIAVPRSLPLVVVEGNYLLLDSGLWAGTSALLDQIWYVDVDQDVRHHRLLRRHMAYGRSRQEAQRWVTGDERNARLIESLRGKADGLIDS